MGGLLQQQEQILCQSTTTSTTSASPSSTQSATSNATVTPMTTETPTSAPMATSAATSAAVPLTVSAPRAKVTEHSSVGDQTSQATGGVGQVPIVKNLNGTLANCSLCQEFRDYLILLDSKIPKPKFQVWLDLVLLCQSIFSLPEAEESEKRKLMVQVGKVYLAGPPEGHKVALPGAAARRELEQHCQALDSDEGNSIPADLPLLRRAAFEFVWQKLEEKHDAWRASRAQPTRLQALLCALL